MTRKKSIIPFLILILIIFLFQNLIAQERKKCPSCNSNFPSEYNFCPYDGKELLPFLSSAKDINGFQGFQWEMSINKVKEILGNSEYEVDSSKLNFISIQVMEFKFQNKEASLELEFYNDKLYKISVHFMVDNNVSGFNEYILMAELLQEIYGDTDKITVGREGIDDNHSVLLIRIRELYYQYIWQTISGNLTFQLSAGDSNHFACSLFFSSQNAEQINKKKIISEF